MAALEFYDGTKWVIVGGGGGVASITAGANISISGTAKDPIIALTESILISQGISCSTIAITSLNSGILKVTDGLVSLATADIDYATSATLEAIKAETEVYRDDALSFKNDAYVSSVQSETSASSALTYKLDAQASAQSADEDANAAYMTYQQVLDLFNNFINNQMTTSYANIEISSALDPNSPIPKFQNFKTYYPPQSTNTNPKLGTNYAIIDSALPNTDNFSRIWGILAEMGSETAINSSLKFTFNHKLLSNPFTPFVLQLSAGVNPGDYISLVNVYSNINLNNNKITGITTTEEGSSAVNRDYLVQYVADHTTPPVINLTGAVTGTLDGNSILTKLSQEVPIDGKYTLYSFKDTGQYGVPYYNNFSLPSNEPSPIYDLISQTGSSSGANPTLRKCTISMYQGVSSSIQSRMDFSIYHSLLPNTKTITPLSLGYSIADSKAKLDVFGILDLNNNPIKNIPDPVNAKDPANKSWVENLVVGSVGINLTGSVTGSGTGTVATSFNRFQTIDNVDNTQTWTYNYNVSTGQLVSYHNTILSDTSASTRKFINRVVRKSLSDNQFQWEHDIAGQAISDSQSIKMNFVNGSNNPGTFTLFSASKINNVMSASFNSSLGILDGTLSSHAVTKSQLDNKKLNEFGVTSDVDLGVYKMSSSTAPTQGNHFCNKTYTDNIVSSNITLKSVGFNRGDIVQLDNLRIRMAPTGEYNVEVATVSGTMAITYTRDLFYAPSTWAVNSAFANLTTTFSKPIAGNNLNTDGSYYRIHITDTTNNRFYRCTTYNASVTNSKIPIILERLI